MITLENLFYGETEEEVMEKNKEFSVDKFEVEGGLRAPSFAKHSQELVSLMLSLLNEDPTKRPSAKEALAHPWFDGNREAIEKGLKLNAERGGTEISRLVERVKSGLLSQAQKPIGFLIRDGSNYLSPSAYSEFQELRGLTERNIKDVIMPKKTLN
jgi:serine/threonine protein kinase